MSDGADLRLDYVKPEGFKSQSETKSSHRHLKLPPEGWASESLVRQDEFLMCLALCGHIKYQEVGAEGFDPSAFRSRLIF